MTHGDFPGWATYSLTVIVAVLWIASERFAGRRIGLLVQRYVPPRFVFARWALLRILALVFSCAIAMLLMLVAILCLYAIGNA